MKHKRRPTVFRQTTDEMMELMRKRLRAVRGDWFGLSLISGVPYFTIAKLHQQETKNPRLATFVALSKALDRVEAGEPLPTRRTQASAAQGQAEESCTEER